MRVSVFVVNYHADEHLARFVASVQVAARAADVRTEIHVLDNSSRDEEGMAELRRRMSDAAPHVEVHSTGRNEGYFGVLPLAQSLTRRDEVDSVIYCNPDVLLAPDFFRELMPVRQLGGVLAPAIVAIGEGFDQNPKYVERLTVSKLKWLRAVYSSQLTYGLHTVAARMLELLTRFLPARRRSTAPASSIYAPHGAVFVFSDVHFFLALPAYPCFLFGEELFVAEEALRRGVRVVYAPGMKVSDVRHASVSRLGSRKLRSYMLESVSYLLTHYFLDTGGRLA